MFQLLYLHVYRKKRVFFALRDLVDHQRCFPEHLRAFETQPECPLNFLVSYWASLANSLSYQHLSLTFQLLTPNLKSLLITLKIAFDVFFDLVNKRKDFIHFCFETFSHLTLSLLVLFFRRHIYFDDYFLSV